MSKHIAVTHVFYNDGSDPDVYAIVKKENADGTLNLFIIPDSGNTDIVNGVPQREKADYDEAGGGRTWHSGA